VQLGAELEQQCVRAMQCLGLRFTGMDLREDAEGRARFLELNSSPMFLGFEQLAGVQIGRYLCDALQREPAARPELGHAFPRSLSTQQ